MPLRPVHCWARSRVRPISPALVAEYAAWGRPAGGQAEHAADVHDAGPRLHHPAARLRHPVAAVEVHVDDLAELLGGLPGGGYGGPDPGVVDQHVDPAELLHRRVDQRAGTPRGRRRRSARPAPAGPPPRRARGSPASLSTRRAPSTTSAPASARAWANATPSPEEAPVTIATLPSRRNRSSTVMDPFGGGSRSLPVSRVRGLAGPPGAGHHLVDGVPHPPVEVAGGEPRRTPRSAPGRRAAAGAISGVKSMPVTRAIASMICRTDSPSPLPRL